MKRATSMGCASVRLSAYLDSRGGNALRDMNKDLADKAMRAFNGNLSVSARSLGITKKTLKMLLLGGNDGGEWSEKGALIREGYSK